MQQFEQYHTNVGMSKDEGLLEIIRAYNCSIYYISRGYLNNEDYFNKYWTNNSNILPAYFITNCSVSQLLNDSRLLSLNSSGPTDFSDLRELSRLEKVNDGDALIALIFTVSGCCISFWLLLLLIYISPRQGMKPLSIQVTTIFHCFLSTITFVRLTLVSKEGFYEGVMDLYKLTDYILASDIFRVPSVLSHFITNITFLDIVLRIVLPKYRWPIAIVSLLLIAGSVVTQSLFMAKNAVIDGALRLRLGHAPTRLLLASNIMELCVFIWLSFMGFYYTLFIMDPKRVCYERNLLPKAIFVWLLFFSTLALNLVKSTKYLSDLLYGNWLSMLQWLLHVCMIVCLWEWIYDIKYLLRRFEELGMLGRKLSEKDAVSFRLGNRTTLRRNPFFSFPYKWHWKRRS